MEAEYAEIDEAMREEAECCRCTPPSARLTLLYMQPGFLIPAWLACRCRRPRSRRPRARLRRRRADRRLARRGTRTRPSRGGTGITRATERHGAVQPIDSSNRLRGGARLSLALRVHSLKLQRVERIKSALALEESLADAE